MTLDSIINSQRKLEKELRKHAADNDTGITFRADIADCFNIAGKAKVYGSAGHQIFDAVTVWLLYLRGYVAYNFTDDRWVVRPEQAHALMFEMQIISDLIEREGGVSRH